MHSTLAYRIGALFARRLGISQEGSHQSPLQKYYPEGTRKIREENVCF
jgi:hypothetical protein